MVLAGATLALALMTQRANQEAKIKVTTSTVYEVQVEEVQEVPVEIKQTPVAEEPKYVTIGTFRCTAYCSCAKCCGKWASKQDPNHIKGARGVDLVSGYSIAVDPKVIPLGSTVYIDGKEYRADDTGGAIKGNRIDVYFNNHSTAVSYAVQKHEVKKKVK